MAPPTSPPAGCPSRIAKFDAIFNFRDIGGLTARNGLVVRPGAVFRSSRPDHGTEGDLHRLSRVHGVRTIVDLRSPEETKRRSGKGLSAIDTLYLPETLDVPARSRRPHSSRHAHHGEADKHTVAHVHTHAGEVPQLRRIRVKFIGRTFLRNAVFGGMSVFVRVLFFVLFAFDAVFRTAFSRRLAVRTVVRPRGIAGQYKDFIDHCRDELVAVLRIVASAEARPVLIHCAHGKDRTGVVLAVILAILGVSEDDIALDYALTETGLADVRPRLVKEIVTFGLSEEFAGASPETMRATLAHVRASYGSMERYLAEGGFGEDEQERMREALLVAP